MAAVSWRLQSKGGEQEGPPSAKVPRTRTSRASLGRNEDDETEEGEGNTNTNMNKGMRNMIMNMQKLSLFTIQGQRALAGGLWTTFIAPPGLECVAAGVAAKEQYFTGVEGNKNHGKGSPHIHVSIAFLEGLIKQTSEQDKDWMLELHKAMEKGGPTTIHEITPYFAIKDLRQNGGKKANGKKTNAGDAEDMSAEEGINKRAFLVQIHFGMAAGVQVKEQMNVMVALHYKAAIIKHMQGKGATMEVGTPPPPKVQRQVQQDLDKLQRQNG